MAIKYYEIPERKQVVAVLNHTQWDAYNKIDKMLSNTNLVLVEPESVKRDKYRMPDSFRVVVTCDPRDEYDFETGAQIAKKRLMRNYYKSLDKKLNAFTDELTVIAFRLVADSVTALNAEKNV